MGQLLAGVARVDITPPVPMDCVGYVRRVQPVTDVATPLLATALVLADEQSGSRCVIVAFDLIAIGIEQGRRIRSLIADHVGCSPDAVLLNYSHTHAAPYPFDDQLTYPKLGGTMGQVSEANATYVQALPHRLASVAFQAAQHLVPVRIAGGSGQAEGLAVNRRERLPDGRTVLGWNQELSADPEVGVIRIDRADGRPFAVVVNFACHPVVLGWAHSAIDADFPGIVCDSVERATGATCLFLQGAAGNVLPLAAFFDEPGPERAFGERLAHEALAAHSRLRTTVTDIERRVGNRSVTPMILYRHQPRDPQPPQPIAALTRMVRFPLKALPSLATVEQELDRHQSDLARAEAAGESPAMLNPLRYHVMWAQTAVAKLREGRAETFIEGLLQVLRIGDVAIAAVPGEPFSEIGVTVKERSVAPYTVFCGYSNEYLAYFPTAAEYPYGGYEPGYSHHNSTLLEQVAPDCEELIVSNLLAMIEELFG